MTSLHRLIATIFIWLVVAVLGIFMQGLALAMPPLMIGLLFAALLLSAAVATSAIARGPGPA